MPAQTTTNAHLSHEARGEAEWNANPALREAFHRGGLSGYTAYAKAVESGRARQVGHDLKAELAALRGA